MCRPVGCRPDSKYLSPTRLSPKRFVAQMTGDPCWTVWRAVKMHDNKPLLGCVYDDEDDDDDDYEI